MDPMWLRHHGDEISLWRLSTGYAFGLDTRDGERFSGVFTPDGSLTITFLESSVSPSRSKGHYELRRVPEKLGIYAKTLHVLGQSEYQIDAGTAQGLTYCLAHHYSVGEQGGLDLVMHMSYEDVYNRDADGRWKIASRTGLVHWTETRSTTAHAPDHPPARSEAVADATNWTVGHAGESR